MVNSVDTRPEQSTNPLPGQTAVVADQILIGAADASICRAGDDKWRLSTAGRSVTVRMDPAAADGLARLVAGVLPLLDTALPLRALLSNDQLELLTPYLDLLVSTGLLLTPGSDPTPIIGGPTDVQLYSYVSRRSPDPDRVYRLARAKRIAVHGPEHWVTAVVAGLREQGLTVTAGESWFPGDDVPPANDVDLAVVIGTYADPAAAERAEGLAGVNRAWAAAGLSWVPVVVRPTTVQLGPWTLAGDSACLGCLLGAGLPARGAVVGHSGSAATDFRPASVRSESKGWTSSQPAALRWATGLLSHLMLRAFVPIGQYHPWGTVNVLDAERLEHSSIRVWRDPSCPDCGSLTPRLEEWIEQ